MTYKYGMLILVVYISFLSLKCKDDVLPPPPPQQEVPQWRVIPQFATLDIHWTV